MGGCCSFLLRSDLMMSTDVGHRVEATIPLQRRLIINSIMDSKVDTCMSLRWFYVLRTCFTVKQTESNIGFARLARLQSRYTTTVLMPLVLHTGVEVGATTPQRPPARAARLAKSR